MTWRKCFSRSTMPSVWDALLLDIGLSERNWSRITMVSQVRRDQRLGSLWAALVILVSLYSPFQATYGSPIEKAFSRYPSKDSGVIARSRGEHDLHWLDNDRIVFIGSKPGETRVENGRQFPKSDLFVWNITTSDVRRAAELSNRSRLCVASGYVRYDLEREGVLYARFGEFSRTHEAEVDVQAMKDGILAVSPVSCKEYNPKLLRKRYGDWALPLLQPGEYLDKSSPHYAAYLRYFPQDGSDPIELPKIPNRDVIATPKYSEYLRKYVFDELRRRSGAEFSQRVWLLDRRGNVEETVLPAGPWMAGSVRAMPAQGGWVMASHALDLRGGFGAAGLYLVKGGQTTRLMTGYPHAFAVSPDGCKAATSLEVKRGQETARPTVWTIDLCAKGK